MFFHKPVMHKEIIAFLKESNKKILVDATAGGGGHLATLRDLVGKEGLVLAFDKDLRAHELDAAGGVSSKNPHVVKLIHSPFSGIKNYLKLNNINKIDGLLCDLGVSSEQLDNPCRGFSFMREGLLDMRMDQKSDLTAYKLLEKTPEKELSDMLFLLGGERKSRQIASLIKKSWPIKNSTTELASLITRAIRPKKYSKIHPATRSFQAIRMTVNRELEELTNLLTDLPDILEVGGIAVFISFHSVEDRLIKQSFKNLGNNNMLGKQFEILTKKPLVPDEEETKDNKRARSAKLRAIKRVL